jgi:hypothetical protein
VLLDFDKLTQEKKLLKDPVNIPTHLANLPTVDSEDRLIKRRQEAMAQHSADATGNDRHGQSGVGAARGNATPPAKGKARKGTGAQDCTDATQTKRHAIGASSEGAAKKKRGGGGGVFKTT